MELVDDEFFRLQDESLACYPSYFKDIWESMFDKVISTTGGTILFGGAIGSRLYNLNEDNSDLDMFIVYQAPSDCFMSYEKHYVDALKNKDNHQPDYAIYELGSFCQLLLQRDTRAIELIYTASQYPLSDPTLIYYISSEFKLFIQQRILYLSPVLAKKYISEFSGVKGMKKLHSQEKYYQKLLKENNINDAELAKKRLYKGFYIMHRLLYQSRMILILFGFSPEIYKPNFEVFDSLVNIKVDEFTCYFNQGTKERDIMLKIRKGELGLSYENHIEFFEKELIVLQNIIDSLKDDAFQNKKLNDFFEKTIRLMRIKSINDKLTSLDNNYSFNFDTIPLAKSPLKGLLIYYSLNYHYLTLK